MNEPDAIVANTTVTWNEQWTDYPAPSWTCVYTINGPVKLIVTAAALGSSFQITIPAADTKTLYPGTYGFQAIVSKSGQSFIVSQGTITVRAGLADLAAGQEQRSFNKQMLDALEASMVGTAANLPLETTIAGRTVRYPDLASKIKAHNFYAAAVKREKIAERAGNGADDPGGKILIRNTRW